MLSTDTAYLNMNDSLARRIKGEVGLFDGSTSLGTYSPSDALQSIHVERIGDSGKFFGFGICQKAVIKLVDKNRTITPVKGNIARIMMYNNDVGTRICPDFIVTDVVRDEKTNTLTLTCYDRLYTASTTTLNDAGIDPNSYARTMYHEIAEYLGVGYLADASAGGSTRGNFTGEETLRTVLNMIAEVSQSIYFIDRSTGDTYYDVLYMKTLDIENEPVLTISNGHYFELTTEPARTITGIAHITELGDNVVAGDGTIQYLRDNAIYIRESSSLAVMLENAVEKLAGLTITPCNCVWRGNFVTQIGDKIAIKDKSGADVITYILNDTFDYTGGFKQTTSWSYEEQKQETATPTTIGEKINHTSAKVDKVNQEITLLASSVADQNEKVTEQIAQLQVTTSNITASVSEIQERHDAELDSVNDRVDAAIAEASLKVDADGVEILVQKAISDGVDKVVTSGKKYTFDDTGLDISSSGSNISTKITEDGMRIYRAGSQVLTADNEGVNAEDLHATTYLIIGKTSRLEDRGSRTACFWIGG